MATTAIRRALISVYDKTGAVEFARALHDDFGVEIISTGGTARALQQAGIPVTLVEQITGCGEMLDGRVKTLHPNIHAAILADRDNPGHVRQLSRAGIEPIDMVVVNLYPFERTIADPACTLEQAVEMIDIGGPCLLRAAAKNHKSVVVVCRTEQYDTILQSMRQGVPSDQRMRIDLAAEAFAATNDYDDAISDYFIDVLYPDRREQKDRNAPELGEILPAMADWDATLEAKLRYGENPHQDAGVYEPIFGEWEGGIDAANLVLSKVLQGEMSFNNYVDANAAFELCREIAIGQSGAAVAVFVKHTNPCGVGVAADAVEAYRLAYLGDAGAAFGGVLAISERVDARIAEAVMASFDRWGQAAGASGFFAEVWVAPSFDREAIELMHKAKAWGQRVRLLPVADMLNPPNVDELDFKKIAGGMLVQTRDLPGLNEDEWQVVTKREPSESEWKDLRLAWLVCKHTKSNAISICRDGQLLGSGAGQMSRVVSCRIASWLAKENGHAQSLTGSVAASDAFFPFRDGPDILADAGVTAIIQPGGSKRDSEIVEACTKRDIAMVFTGTRHFRH